MTDAALADSAPVGHQRQDTGSKRGNTALGCALVALLAFGWLLPKPVREILLASACVPLPWALWSAWLAARLRVAPVVATGLGLIVSLAGWSLLFFVVMWAGSSASYVASACCLVLLCAIPLGTMSLRQFTAGINATSDQLARSASRAVVMSVPVALGCAAIAFSMMIARRDGDTNAAYAVFGVGTLALYGPALIAAIRWPAGNLMLICTTLAIATYAHIFIRSPLHPLMNDELGHFGETQTILRTGKLFLPDSVVGVGPAYPGLQTLAAPLVRLSGLPVMWVAQGLVLMFHVAALAGIGALAALLVRPEPRVIAVAMFVYSVGPSMLQIDGIYAYESFGVPLVIWLVYLLIRATGVHGADRVVIGCAAVVALDLVVTHHLSSFMAAAILILLGVGAAFARSGYDASGPHGFGGSHQMPGSVRTWLLPITGIAISVLAILWSVLKSAKLINYLGGIGPSTFTALLRTIGLTDEPTDGGTYQDQQGSSRGLFLNSSLPHYERLAALAAQPVLLLAFVAAVVVLWRRRTGYQVGLMLLGMAYFASLPLTLVAGASSPAHRSWAFSYIGLAVVLSALAATRDQRARARKPLGSLAGRVPWTAVGVCAALVVLVGNYGSAVNAYQRLPGPFVLGADGRNVTPDIVRSAKWLAANEGYGQRILTTFRIRAVFGAYADTQGISFPGWDVLFPTSAPSAQVVDEVRGAGIKYLVIDRRLSTNVSVGQYFGIAGEPDPPDNPLPLASTAKFASLPWLTRIHVDDNISIYKVR